MRSLTAKNFPFLKDQKLLLEVKEVDDYDGPQGYLGPQRRRRVSTVKALALACLVLVVLSGVILTMSGILPRWTPSRPWGMEKEMVMGTSTAPSTPPATTLVKDTTDDDDDNDTAKFEMVNGTATAPLTPLATALNKDIIVDNAAKLHDFFLEDYMESVLADHGIFPKKETELKTHKLNKRAPPQYHRCSQGTIWRGRYCRPEINMQAWRDYCKKPFGQDETHDGTCPAESFCEATQDRDGSSHISCTSMKQKEQNNSASGSISGRPVKVQYGKRQVNQPAKTKDHTARGEESIPLLSDMDNASASAFFVNNDMTFLIKPLSEMYGIVSGWSTKVCRSLLTSPGVDERRDCKPMLRWNYNRGDTLEIHWGMSDYQAGFVFYLISEQ